MSKSDSTRLVSAFKCQWACQKTGPTFMPKPLKWKQQQQSSYNTHICLLSVIQWVCVCVCASLAIMCFGYCKRLPVKIIRKNKETQEIVEKYILSLVFQPTYVIDLSIQIYTLYYYNIWVFYMKQPTYFIHTLDLFVKPFSPELLSSGSISGKMNFKAHWLQSIEIIQIRLV